METYEAANVAASDAYEQAQSYAADGASALACKPFHDFFLAHSCFEAACAALIDSRRHREESAAFLWQCAFAENSKLMRPPPFADLSAIPNPTLIYQGKAQQKHRTARICGPGRRLDAA